MLRSLYSGISGLRAHQTMLDVTGNNIANVNTQGFKASSVEFQDTLSQMTSGGSSPQAGNGGTNPAQVGLGVQVAAISTNFTQGSSQATGKGTDLMISGSGFFVVKQGGETLYTRAGSLSQDAQGNLVTPDGGILQGWTAVNGAVSAGGPVQNLTFSNTVLSPATATTTATASGNLPSGGAGSPLTRDVQVYDAQGNASNVTLTFNHTGGSVAAGTDTWDVTDPAGNSVTLNFKDGKQDAANPASLNVNGAVPLDLTTITGFANLSTVAAKA
ncbi:MAG TPA: flagellar hook-basal body complex protein, partial [Micrococcaceae bacterium]